MDMEYSGIELSNGEAQRALAGQLRTHIIARERFPWIETKPYQASVVLREYGVYAIVVLI